MRLALLVLAATLVASAVCAPRAWPQESADPPPKGQSEPLRDALLMLATKGERNLSGGKVMDGEKAKPGDDPWQAALTPSAAKDDELIAFCGGSIIARSWVLTAAHCVDNGTPAGAVSVLVATTSLDAGGQRIAVKAIHPHPLYRPKPEWRYDVALLELAEPAPIEAKSVTTITAKQEPDALAEAVVARIAGWGMVAKDAAGGVRDLRFINLPIITNDSCTGPQKWDGKIASEMVCAFLPKTPTAACQGDSGGPLTVTTADGRRLAALVSWGAPCGQKLPGVYMRVAPLAEWIADCQAGAKACDHRTKP